MVRISLSVAAVVLPRPTSTEPKVFIWPTPSPVILSRRAIDLAPSSPAMSVAVCSLPIVSMNVLMSFEPRTPNWPAAAPISSSDSIGTAMLAASLSKSFWNDAISAPAMPVVLAMLVMPSS